MSKKNYNKPALSVTDQIALLESRGVVFADKAAALDFLTYNNYYYVSGYTYYFERHAINRSHQFESPLRFESIKALVDFDQKLRHLFWLAIQPVEIALRASIARHISISHGAFCLANPQILRKQHLHSGLLDRLHKALNEHKNEPFISHFMSTYQEPLPPAWVMIEVLTFGTISWLFANLRTDLQKRIAADFQVDHIVLVSWLKGLTELRNTCAHHMRLWNKVFVNAPEIQNSDKQFPLALTGSHRLGTFIPLIRHMLKTLQILPTWESELARLCTTCPYIKPLDLGLAQWWLTLPTPQALTVQSLIDQLKLYDPTLPVVLPSFEDGFDHLTHLRPLNIEPSTPPPAWYNGTYQENPEGLLAAVLLYSIHHREEKS